MTSGCVLLPANMMILWDINGVWDVDGIYGRKQYIVYPITVYDGMLMGYTVMVLWKMNVFAYPLNYDRKKWEKAWYHWQKLWFNERHIEPSNRKVAKPGKYSKPWGFQQDWASRSGGFDQPKWCDFINNMWEWTKKSGDINITWNITKVMV